MGSTQATIAIIAGCLGVISTAVGIFIAWNNWKAQKKARIAADRAEASAKTSEQEAAFFKERAGSIESLQRTVAQQQEIIDGLSKGLRECITRDNDKATEIGKLREQSYQNAVEINTLRQRVNTLEVKYEPR